LIFVTVGGQMPFDRLIQAVDEWAAAHPGHEVFGQIADAAYRPRSFPAVERLSSQEFRARIEAARIVVSHAGMGTILTALEVGKPLLVLPRLGRLAETRNDHQVATARWFAEAGLLSVAADEHDLPAQLDRMQEQAVAPRIGRAASAELLGRLQGFLRGEAAPGRRDVAA